MDQEACMQPGTPGVEHERLEQFAGTWKATTRHWMSPDADPQVGTGIMTNTWVLGSRFLRQDYLADGGEFEGTGYWGYNTITGEYEGLWIDTMSTGMLTDAGTCNDAGDEWTMRGETVFPAFPKPCKKRTVIKVVDADHHLMEMYMDMGTGENKVMEIEYERKG